MRRTACVVVATWIAYSMSKPVGEWIEQQGWPQWSAVGITIGLALIAYSIVMQALDSP